MRALILTAAAALALAACGGTADDASTSSDAGVTAVDSTQVTRPPTPADAATSAPPTTAGPLPDIPAGEDQTSETAPATTPR